MTTEATGPLGQVAQVVTTDVKLVTGVATEKIRVLGMMVTAVSGCTFRLVSGANVYVPPVTLAANAQYQLPVTGLGWFDVATAGDLDIAISGGNVNIIVRYQRIK